MFRNIKIRVIISVVLAILMGFLSYSYLEKFKEKVNVVVANQDIPKYTLLSEEHLTFLSINKLDRETIFPYSVYDKNELIGTITRIDIKKNIPIERTPDNLVMDKERAVALNYSGGVDKSYFIPYEKRVIAVQVDNTGTLNNTLKRGDFIDVIFTSTDDSTGGLYSNMILQHIEIFDIPEYDEKNNKNGRSLEKKDVLLLATPEECLVLAAANRNGTLDLVLNPLKGERKQRNPVHVLSFVAEEPASKSERLSRLEQRIRLEELTDLTKEQLLTDIEQEKEIETILRTIEASNLPQELKDWFVGILKENSGGQQSE